MERTQFIRASVFLSFSILLFNCVQQKTMVMESPFTKADSLAEQYLELHDKMVQAWHIMIHDDNHKLTMMHNLIESFRTSGRYDDHTITTLDKHLDRLKTIRYDQRTIADSKTVKRYDAASDSLFTALNNLISDKPFTHNIAIQDNLKEIRAVIERAGQYRRNYDEITIRYNTFLENNKEVLAEVDTKMCTDQRPLFHAVSEK